MITAPAGTVHNDWKKDNTSLFPERCVINIIEDQCAKKPRELAIVYKEERINYSSFNKRVNQVAHFLRTKG
ncbi:hypothetical protein, partial [Segetibacter sp.]|uniref:hypothetical protein n=1 Tax=Segetibacter sp. TaxID=2231182 RepID=UPI0026259393